MGGSGKSYYQYDASSMDQEKLHTETTSSTKEQYPKYSREASRHKNTQQIGDAAIYTPPLLAFDEAASSEGTLYI